MILAGVLYGVLSLSSLSPVDDFFEEPEVRIKVLGPRLLLMKGKEDLLHYQADPWTGYAERNPVDRRELIFVFRSPAFAYESESFFRYGAWPPYRWLCLDTSVNCMGFERIELFFVPYPFSRDEEEEEDP